MKDDLAVDAYRLWAYTKASGIGRGMVTFRGFGASELYQALRSCEQTGAIHVG
jgi:hypothetical protein